MVQRTRGRLRSAEDWLIAEHRGLYGAAVCRIGISASVLGLLLSNFSDRQVWVGQASVWADPAREISQFPEIALLDGVSGDITTAFYLLTMAAAFAFLLGWHAKAANVVTLIGFIAIVAQNPVVSDESDNLVRIALLWLLLVQSSRRWSLDARRRRRDAESEQEHPAGDDVLPEWLSRGLHHVGLIGLMAQAVLLFTASGLDKVSQSVWQRGTAMYSTMQLPEFRPFPGLSDWVSESSVPLALLTYAVLVTQLFFAPLMLNPVSRRVMIAAAVVVNVMVAILLALPWSSLACLALVALFVSSATYERIGAWLADVLAPAGDWFVLRGYDLQDAWFAVAERTYYPVVDWVRTTILRR